MFNFEKLRSGDSSKFFIILKFLLCLGNGTKSSERSDVAQKHGLFPRVLRIIITLLSRLVKNVTKEKNSES